MKKAIREVIVVEGRYDKNALSQVVDATIITLGGFAVFNDREKQAYIPDIPGKERRKAAPGKEGKLGVEGMKPAVLLEALRRAGATFADEGAAECPGDPITKADLFALGLTGGTDSAAKRRALLKQLDLPEHLTPNGMLEALNLLYSREEFLSRMVKTQ